MSARDRRRAVALAGHTGDTVTARRGIDDPDPKVRASALGALARLGELHDEDLRRALADPEPSVRRRAAQLAAAHPDVDLRATLHDRNPLVAEAAAWACGEHPETSVALVDELVGIAGSHADALVREAAVAALGAIGDPRGLPAILAAMHDKPAVRRRAVIALTPFDGAEVDAAIRTAHGDRDWQVRQIVQELYGEDGT